MFKYPNKKRYVLGLLCCIPLWTTACDDGQQAESIRQPVVISKKVVVPPRDVSASRKQPSGALKTETVKLSEKDVRSSNEAVAPGLKPEMISESLIVQDSPSENYYNPAGKIDPFAPLFREKKVAESKVSKQGKKKKRVARTPLEKIDLSQLKLVGILQSESKNRALVEEASGKGYIITAGTYIGTKSGRVVRILADSVVVEEESENLLGEITLVKRELKLQKAFEE